MRDRREWLVGTWEPLDETSRVVFEITMKSSGLKVKAWDKDDGEQIVVSKIKWDGKELTFETYLPSSKWRTRNRVKPVSKSRCVQEITFWEPWKKVQGR